MHAPTTRIGAKPFFSVSANPSAVDARQFILAIGAGGMGMSDSRFYSEPKKVSFFLPLALSLYLSRLSVSPPRSLLLSFRLAYPFFLRLCETLCG